MADDRRVGVFSSQRACSGEIRGIMDDWSKMKVHKIVLSPQDYDKLIENLENDHIDDPRYDKLRRAMQRYKKEKEGQIEQSNATCEERT